MVVLLYPSFPLIEFSSMILLRRKSYAIGEMNETPEQFGSKLDALSDKIISSPQQTAGEDNGNPEGAQVKIGMPQQKRK